MVLTANGQAPYAPAKTITSILIRYRDRGLQTPITSDVLLKAGVPDSLTQRVQQTLRLLDFIDDLGRPNSTFEQLQRAPEEEYRRGLSDMITAAYAEVYLYADPAVDGMDRLRDAFRGFNPRGQQERMISLFLGLCEFAGIDAGAALLERRNVADSSTRVVNRKQPKDSGRPTTPTRGAERKREKPDAHIPATTAMAGLPQGLVGLLQQIPLNGAGWPKSKRDEFMAAFGAVLDFSVPVRAHEPASEQEAEVTP